MNSSCSNPADRPIAVFDSGLGGLTVVGELMRALPGEDVIYLGDSARVPYGIKSLETVRRFAIEDARFLLRARPKMLVVACNTASAAGIDALEAMSDVDVVDVIRPGAADACAAAEGPLGVIATEATIASGAYQRAIRAIDPSREVLVASCPLLVPIVEEGRDQEDPIVLHVLCDYLPALQRARPGALILGCTHYPLLSGAIGKLMGPQTKLISSARSAARHAQQRLVELDLLARRERAGRLVCYTTDNPKRFASVGRRFSNRPLDEVHYVGTDELESFTHAAPIAPADRRTPSL